MDKKFKVAFIGCGGRSLPYARYLHKSGMVEVVACAEPSRQNLRNMLSHSGIPEKSFRYYDNWQELCEKEKELDGAVIITPNHLHADPAIEMIKRRIPLALEKPLTTTMEDSERLLDAVREYRPQLILGFVLRSTPFYKIVREVLDSGRIGRVISIQADELVTPGISSVISRSPWRRYARFSGGTMMEKSSHDMDLMNWFAGGCPVAVNSFGGSLLLRPNPSLPMKCADCAVREKCAYYQPVFSEHAGDSVLQKSLQNEMGSCIYNIDKDVADNQVVSIRYSNGVIVNFTLAFNCIGDRAGRNIHIIGSKGRLWGSIDANRIGINDTFTGKTEYVDVPVVEGGHNGGDSMHAEIFLKMMKDRDFHPEQNAYAGYLSNALCIASDFSVAESRQIHFRYGANGYIRFE